LVDALNDWISSIIGDDYGLSIAAHVGLDECVWSNGDLPTRLGPLLPSLHLPEQVAHGNQGQWVSEDETAISVSGSPAPTHVHRRPIRVVAGEIDASNFQ
jgi:hypothetical protein